MLAVTSKLGLVASLLAVLAAVLPEGPVLVVDGALARRMGALDGVGHWDLLRALYAAHEASTS
jgi:hypothetical protein